MKPSNFFINKIYFLSLLPLLSAPAEAAGTISPILQICANRRADLDECKTGRSARDVALIDGVKALKPLDDYFEKRKFLVRIAERTKAEADHNVKAIERHIACLRAKPDLTKSSPPKACDKESFAKLRQMAKEAELNLPVFQRAAILRGIASGAPVYKFNRYFKENPDPSLLSPGAELYKDLGLQPGDELPGPPGGLFDGFFSDVKTKVPVTEPVLRGAASQLVTDVRAVKVDVLKRIRKGDDLDYADAQQNAPELDAAWKELFHDKASRRHLYGFEEAGTYTKHDMTNVGKFYSNQYESILSAHPHFRYMPSYSRREELPAAMATALEKMLENHARPALAKIDKDIKSDVGVTDDLLKYILEEDHVTTLLKADLAKEPYPMSCKLAEEFHGKQETKGKAIRIAVLAAGAGCLLGTVASVGILAKPCLGLFWATMAYNANNNIVKYEELRERADRAYSQLSPKDKKAIEKLISDYKVQNLTASLFVVEGIAGQLGLSFGDLLGKLNINGLVSHVTKTFSLSPGVAKSFMDQLLTNHIHGQITKARNEVLKSAVAHDGGELGALADTYARSQQIRDQLVNRLDFNSARFDKEGFCEAVKSTLASARDLDEGARKSVRDGARNYGCKI